MSGICVPELEGGPSQIHVLQKVWLSEVVVPKQPGCARPRSVVARLPRRCGKRTFVGMPDWRERAQARTRFAGGRRCEVGGFEGSSKRLSGLWSGFEHGGSPFSSRRRPSDHPTSFTPHQPAAATHARRHGHAWHARGDAARLYPVRSELRCRSSSGRRTRRQRRISAASRFPPGREWRAATPTINCFSGPRCASSSR